MDGVLCLERYGLKKGNQAVVYTHDRLSGKMKASEDLRGTSSFVQVLKNIFLPQGYPDSVSDDYLEYQVWDTIQAFCSSITGALATQAVLKGSGVGDETASVTGATLTWLLKDGTGMVGRIAFAYYKGTNLDHDAKKWRLFADVLNDCAIFTTLIAPLFPKVYFTPITCLAGLAFSLVGVAGGCTRAALTMHQARRDNMADVSAKDGSQETLVNLTALIINIFLTPFVSGNLLLTWVLFIIFTSLHIYSNYRAVKCVVMDTLNYARLKVIINHCYISPGNGEILDPKSANDKEPVLKAFPNPCINAGCNLKELGLESEQFIHRLNKDPEIKFLWTYSSGGLYSVALRDTAKPQDIIRAYYNAEMEKVSKDPKQQQINFIEALKAKGWDVGRHQLSADEWRWSTQEMDKIK